MKNIAILGSTGSIGKQALDIVRRHSDKFKIVALSAGKNITELQKQIDEFKPEIISISSEELKNMLKTDIPIYFGMDGLTKVATYENADTVLTSIVGSIGLKPTIEAIKAKKTIALANKETLVAAGELVMNLAKENGVTIMPVDSEHSALFQCLNGEKLDQVKRMLITCSGGSFRGKKLGDLKDVTVKDALAHPNWNMGGKITIDSATLMNKGLEVIEAHHLYNIPYENIEVVVHPQSIIHSMVEYIDGSIMAELGLPDMRLPILYALSYPDRFNLDLEALDFTKLKQFTFEEPDLETFANLKYAIEAGKQGGVMPCILNAANEIAVEYFLSGKIRFLQIQETVKFMLDNNDNIQNPDIDTILETDKNIKQKTREYLDERCSQ